MNDAFISKKTKRNQQYYFVIVMYQVCRLLALDLCVMVSVWYLQFYQPMVITSLIVSLVPTTILSLQVCVVYIHVHIVRSVPIEPGRQAPDSGAAQEYWPQHRKGGAGTAHHSLS